MIAVSPEEDSLTISPRDGSETVSYQLTDEALVLRGWRRIDLGGVQVDDPARVIGVDGEVKVVLVGPIRPWPRTIIRPHIPRHWPSHGGLGKQMPLNLDRACDFLPMLCGEADGANSIQPPAFNVGQNTTNRDTL